MTGKRIFGACAAALALVAALAGCNSTAADTSTTTEAEETTPVAVRVASLKGPTSMGLVDLMQKADAGEAEEDYTFTMATAADEIVASVVKGDVDIALVPANVASVLYNKTDGGVSVIDINTLSVLTLVTGDESVTSLADLAGKTVYLTGKGTTPEYVTEYLLKAYGIEDQVTLEFKSEATEVVAELAQDPTAVGIVPQPFATAACVKNDALRQVLNLGDVWTEVSTDGSQLVTGVTIVRNEFLEEHPDAVKTFLAEQSASVDAVNADPAAAGKLVAEYGILESDAVAAKAIPNCSLVCITGDEMQTDLAGYLQVLYDFAPESVGGTLPADSFYWKAD
jgi:NitT/TauT family transport system substrate-binding protein